MGKYNSGILYNVSPAKTNGTNYNSAIFIYTININEAFLLLDNVSLNANLFPKDSFGFDEILESIVNFKLNDKIDFSYTSQLFTELAVLDSYGMSDVAVNILVIFMLSDVFSAEEKLQLMSEIRASDDIDLEDKLRLQSAFELSDTYKITDANNAILDALVETSDSFGMTDKEPRSAVSDFYITRSADGIYDMIMPFGLIIDYSMTHIGFMPECVDTSVEMSGVDGEIIQDSVYKSRIFDIFAVTSDGLSLDEKAEIKERIAYILHATKKDTRQLTFADNETSFDVKYSGQADIATEAPSWLRFEIPLKSASPYGHKEFTKDLLGSGLLTNDGQIEVGMVITISGSYTNPSFKVGNMQLSWTGTISASQKLIINTDAYTCYLLNADGTKVNAMKGFNGNFPKIPIGSIVLTAPSALDSKILTSWKELVLY